MSTEMRGQNWASARTHKHTHMHTHARTDTDLPRFLSLPVPLHSASQLHFRPFLSFSAALSQLLARGAWLHSARMERKGEEKEREREELVERRAFQSYSQKHGRAEKWMTAPLRDSAVREEKRTKARGGASPHGHLRALVWAAGASQPRWWTEDYVKSKLLATPSMPGTLSTDCLNICSQ